jgi:hypothetical protein
LTDAATFVLIPAACLELGYRWRRWAANSDKVVPLLLAFALGGVVYVSLALLLSRQPWWTLNQVFPMTITVPWGADGMAGQNVRSVEQRAYAAFAFLPVIPWILSAKPRKWRVKAGMAIALGLYGGYLIWSLNSPKLMAFDLLLALAPCLLLIPSASVRWGIVATVASGLAALIGSKQICDERLPMQAAFLRHIPNHPWGGRQIEYTFEGCPGQGTMTFGPPPNFLHLPHNIFLDQINDVGIVPAGMLFAACSILLTALLVGFWHAVHRISWNAGLALRWAILSAILTQAIFQPFLYSDRLLFCCSFLFAGALLAEFSFDTPEDSAVASSSRLSRFV